MDEKIYALAKKVMLNYYVIFKSKSIHEEYKPVLNFMKEEINYYYGDSLHLFDIELKNVLSAFEYILHLPRIGFDVQDLDEEMMYHSYDEPHNIIPVPSSGVDFFCRNVAVKVKPTLIIYEEGCEKEAKIMDNISKAHLGCVCLSELSSNLLKEHWIKIGNIMKDISDNLRIPEKSIRLTNKNEQLLLPLIFLSNQFGVIENLMGYNNRKRVTFEEHFCRTIGFHSQLKSLIGIKEKGIVNEEDVKDKLKKMYNEALQKIEVPVIITAPGIANYQLKFREINNNLSSTEKKVINLIGTHRAIAKNGILVELDTLPVELFQELNNLEEHCKKNISNKFVWRILRKIGKIMSEYIGEEKINAIERASQITIFSDFPIGLAILPGTSAPLGCIKPISYRPLTPLTKALEYEFPKQNQIYLGKSCKVIIAECLAKDDKIRAYSKHAWDVLMEMSTKYDGMDIVYYDVTSIENLKGILNRNLDAQILLISAHGAYDKEHNMTGLCIGNDIWNATDNDLHVPPIVLLSACHVSPRGAGVVSVADLFIRAGAMTVLGTFIPVDVRRNALLMGRLFTYIMEAQNGSNKIKTLDDAWSFVVAYNAINEILESSAKLKKWYMSERKDGTMPLIEFTLDKSIGRLRRSHIYEDTITVLREIAKEDNMEEHLVSVIKANGYFPESIFYQMIGYPENVFLYNSVFDDYYKDNK